MTEPVVLVISETLAGYPETIRRDSAVPTATILESQTPRGSQAPPALVIGRLLPAENRVSIPSNGYKGSAEETEAELLPTEQFQKEHLHGRVTTKRKTRRRACSGAVTQSKNASPLGPVAAAAHRIFTAYRSDYRSH